MIGYVSINTATQLWPLSEMITMDLILCIQLQSQNPVFMKILGYMGIRRLTWGSSWFSFNKMSKNYVYLFTTEFWLLTTLKMKPFKNIVRKGQNAGNQHFLHFPQYFLSIPKRTSVVKLNLFCCLQMLWVWNSLKICRLVKSYILQCL